MKKNFDISETESFLKLSPLPHQGCSGGGCGCQSASGGCGPGKSSKCSSCGKRATKLDVYNWLSDIPETGDETRMIEVQFKNTRKGYYLNSNDLELFQGDMVAVEATPGHDIGHVTLTGKLVQIQMKKNNIRIHPSSQKRIYRLAKDADIEKYEQAKAREESTMIRSRQIAEQLGLNMKIGDVEYQGDGSKAIFYYIADERVDFRQLIKVLADEFRVRIEMKQIGARQEAGRIGGIGPCGRELCCASWNTNFISVSTVAARFQDLSLNPQKLAGQCGKLKCCLNYEIDQYIEAYKQMPPKDIVLETKESSYYHFKTDVFEGKITYSTAKHMATNLVTLSKERVFEIIQLNKSGMKPDKLIDENQQNVTETKHAYSDILEGESITRFDSDKRKRNVSSRNNKQKKDGRANLSMENKGTNNRRTQRNHKTQEQQASNNNRKKTKHGQEQNNDVNGGQEKRHHLHSRRNFRKKDGKALPPES